VNWDTGAELAFGFHLTPGMVGEGLLFAVFMGLICGLVPAARAARIEIVHALGERTA
ncbi:MAG: ABC transporter permease, partial [Nitrospira sp. CR2.1]|nr:ABC transporter permease [Nitrospira sp. CR2.1]